jgi:hypothetical protein
LLHKIKNVGENNKYYVLAKRFGMKQNSSITIQGMNSL